MSESQLFSTYETDLKTTLDEARASLDKVPELSGKTRGQTLQSVERSLDESLEIIDSLEIEVSNIAPASRGSYNAKIRNYKDQVSQLKKQLKLHLDEQDRSALFGGANDQQRQQLLQSNATLERTSDRLREASRVAAETENVGASIMMDLRSQREQLENARDTLFEADGYVDKSVRTLRTMSRRLVANKFITYGIIAILIILIFLTLMSKF